MKPAINAAEIHPDTRPALPEPFASRLCTYEGRNLGDHFGLSAFGVRLETLRPGCESALRHWHTESDEFVYVLDGEPTLVTDDGESVLEPGMCVGFRAGSRNAHHLCNRSGQVARFLVVGSRAKHDSVVFPDDDFQWLQDETGSWYAARKDGTRY